MTTREVILDGGSPWGFRMHGGADLQQRLRISRVNPGSKASFKGLREGDFITSIDGQSTKNITNSEAHMLLKSAGNQLKLGLNEDCNESLNQSNIKTVIQETHSETTEETIKTICQLTRQTYTESELMEKDTPKKNGKQNSTNGVISQRSTLSSTASVESPNFADLRGITDDKKNLTMESSLSQLNLQKAYEETNKYRVESPEMLDSTMKSRSLDDEQPIITEINEHEAKVLECNNALIITDASNTIVWESTEELFCTPISNKELANITLISCEDKISLRTFLESLDFKGVPKTILHEYNKPMHNLDVISEEGSEISEIDQKDTSNQRLPFGKIKCEKPVLINLDNYIEDVCKITLVNAEKGSVQVERLSRSSSEDSNSDNNISSPIHEIANEIISTVQNLSLDEESNVAFQREFNDLLREQSFIDRDKNVTKQISSDSDESLYSNNTVICSKQKDVSEEKYICDEKREVFNITNENINESFTKSTKEQKLPQHENENDSNAVICNTNNYKNNFCQKINNETKSYDSSKNENVSKTIWASEPKTARKVNNSQPATPRNKDDPMKKVTYITDKPNVVPNQNNVKVKVEFIQNYLNNIQDFTSEYYYFKKKPYSLKELCLNYLNSLPFGLEMLEELAHVATSMENFTNNIPNLSFHLINNYKNKNSFPDYLNIFKTQILQSNKNNIHVENNKLPVNSTRNTKNNDSFINNNYNVHTKKNRSSSLPKELLAKQMQYLIDCEKEIQEELEVLENEKRRLQKEYILSNENTQIQNFKSTEELLRDQMYNEYMNKVLARQERQKQNIIKISPNKQMENIKKTDHKINDLENEFIIKARKRLVKQGHNLDFEYKNNENHERPLDLLDTNINIFEFIERIPKNVSGVWSPGQKQSYNRDELQREISQDSSVDKSEDSILPVWTPRSAGSSPTSERKEFRPVNFESPILGRKVRTKSEDSTNVSHPDDSWKSTHEKITQKTLTSSNSAPGPGFLDFSRLPKAQNPTITLLQKAREGQIPKSSSCVETTVKKSADLGHRSRTESFSDSDGERSKKIIHISPKKYDGIGPTTKDGMPLILRSEVRDANMSQWYKSMYDTIHKQKPSRYDDEEYVTVRYKQRRAGKHPYSTGYLSEPEVATYDSDAVLSDNKYSTLDRRRPVTSKPINHTSSTLPKTDTAIISYTPEPLRRSDINKTPPGRIEHYRPGQSSIIDNDSKKWWDEVMEIFDGHLEQQKKLPKTKGYLSQALKESGYESDSTLIFRRKDDASQQLSPQEQREVYKIIQKGGEVPLHGLRKLAPERPKEPESPSSLPVEKLDSDPEPESPRKYVENEVTIHYKAPVRQEIKESLSEDELARRQADAMRKIYEEERRRKYLQVSNSDDELHDIKSRRHTDNFTPSQKSPIPLNRYDDFLNDYGPKTISRPKSPEPRLVARALYNFVGQTSRELTFKKGDMIYIRRQVDKNWYEGEINAMVGLFPANYVEIVPYDGPKSTPRKSSEGQARAKYNFIAQTHLELSLAKGELVVVTRRVDDNWFEGRIGGKKGIFPVSYVEVLIDPTDAAPTNNHSKPVASPAAHSLLLNGSAGGKESMGTHTYVPSFPSPDVGVSYRAKPIQVSGNGTYGSLKKNPVDKVLHIETHSEPIPYRALYKYRPQNEDELELLEGDTVYVLEKCDDGWYVGSSERTGSFGTFPGNYVERI